MSVHWVTHSTKDSSDYTLMLIYARIKSKLKLGDVPKKNPAGNGKRAGEANVTDRAESFKAASPELLASKGEGFGLKSVCATRSFVLRVYPVESTWYVFTQRGRTSRSLKC